MNQGIIPLYQLLWVTELLGTSAYPSKQNVWSMHKVFWPLDQKLN